MLQRSLKSRKRFSLKTLGLIMALTLLVFLSAMSLVLIRDWDVLSELVEKSRKVSIPQALQWHERMVNAKQLSLYAEVLTTAVDTQTRNRTERDIRKALTVLNENNPAEVDADLSRLNEQLTQLQADSRAWHLMQQERNAQSTQAHVLLITSDLMLSKMIEDTSEQLKVAARKMHQNQDNTDLVQLMQKYFLANRLQASFASLYGRLSLLPSLQTEDDILNEKSYYKGVLLLSHSIIDRLESRQKLALNTTLDDFETLKYLFDLQNNIAMQGKQLQAHAFKIGAQIDRLALDVSGRATTLAARGAEDVAAHGQKSLKTALAAIFVLSITFFIIGIAMQKEIVRPAQQASLALEQLSNKDAPTLLAHSDLKEMDAINEGVKRLHGAWNEIEAANERLVSMAQLKTQFTSSVSHELRTPLTSIRGFIQLIKRDYESYFLKPLQMTDQAMKATRIAKNLDIISKESTRLSELIDDVLDVAKIESGELAWRDKTTDMAKVIQRTQQAISGEFAIKPSVTLTVDIASDLPKLMLDAHRMQQVLLNLLNNAIKFTTKGVVTMRSWADESSLYISISDQGIGIPQSDFDTIFEKFQQASNSDDLTEKPQGTGLGLAICKQIVEHYGGNIAVASKIGSGTTFTVMLPIV